MTEDLPQDIFDTSDVQKKADSLRKDHSDDDLVSLRKLAKTNLFFLSNTILGFDQLSPNLHGHFCSWMDSTRGWRFRLELMPRGHFKTTIATIADGIQIILPDDTKNQPFPRNLGTNARVLIGHEIIDSAAKNLKIIKDKILNAEFLIALFPELLPDRRIHKVNTEQLELPRANQYPESTFSIMGIGSSGQGNHFDQMKLDDMVGLAAMASITEYKTALEWIRDIPGMFTRLNATCVDFTGVRYAPLDVYHTVTSDYGEQLKVYTRSIYEKDASGENQIIFPEHVTWEEIERLKRVDRKKFNSQYMNNPMDMEGEFEQAWERYYEWLDGHTILVTTGLPGFEKREKIDIRDLDKLVFLDPAMTGNSGLVVTGTDKKDNVYILDAIQEKLLTEKLISKVFGLVEKWNPRAVVIEFVLFSGLYEQLFKHEQRQRQVFFRIIPARTKQKQKEDRVRVLRKWFSNGQIFFHKKFDLLIQQFRTFGSIQEYHMLDALAYGPENWRASAGSEESDRNVLSLEKMFEQRSKTTGYSIQKYG